MKHLTALLISAAACFTMGASAQQNNGKLDRVHIGLTGGVHFNTTQYSNLDSNVFPSASMMTSGMGGIFAEFELGQSRRVALRPTLAFTARNTRLEDIRYAVNTLTGESAVGDLDYDIQANYFDFRLPVVVNLGNPDKVCPYIFVAPVLGLCRGGEITMADKAYELNLDVTKANMSPYHLAAQGGVGVKFPISVGSSSMHLGLEASYEYGLSNTYGSKEKNGEAIAYGLYSPYDLQGSRRYSGFEVAATLSVPLSIFSHHSAPKAVTIPEPYQPPVKQKPVEVRQKPCYTLEEITDLINQGQPVGGLTICAIDVINFEYAKSTLTRESRQYLDKIATLMLQSELEIEVKGHTDGKGSPEFNLELSRKRALAVYNYLVSKGVKKSHLSYSFYGLTQPIADNDTEEGRRLNRRVEFEIH